MTTSMRTGLGRVAAARDRALAEPTHDTRTAALLGAALGVCFITCFATGLLSHLIQHPPSWFHYPARPAGLYRVTQGLHVATGTAAVPLLFAKLWAVAPHLAEWPPVRSAAHALERLSLVPLVAGSVFMLWSGVANVAKWYPYPFNFVPAHYAVAWITIGALIVHIGAKIGLTREALRRGGATAAKPVRERRLDGALTRRRFLWATGTGAGVLTLATIGQTVRPLRRLAVLAPRRPDVGPQHLPVNRSARSAGTEGAGHSPDYRLAVEGKVTSPLTFTLEQLEALPRHSATLPIACVEGWSANATWTGVRVRDLLRQAGAADGATVTVRSMEKRGQYRASRLDPDHAQDGDTLLALELNGERLDQDHGYPVRLIAPNRPGVLQTKWVERLVVT